MLQLKICTSLGYSRDSLGMCALSIVLSHTYTASVALRPAKSSPVRFGLR